LLTLSIVEYTHTVWLEGVPKKLMKSDYGSLGLTYIELETAIPKGNCNSGAGIVLHDNNESLEHGVSFALTAYVAKKRFQCWGGSVCSRITGSNATFPVCVKYPSIKD
jgi:hypothetical protein